VLRLDARRAQGVAGAVGERQELGVADDALVQPEGRSVAPSLGDVPIEQRRDHVEDAALGPPW
jgi:hypothetical protein